MPLERTIRIGKLLLPTGKGQSGAQAEVRRESLAFQVTRGVLLSCSFLDALLELQNVMSVSGCPQVLTVYDGLHRQTESLRIC